MLSGAIIFRHSLPSHCRDACAKGWSGHPPFSHSHVHQNATAWWPAQVESTLPHLLLRIMDAVHTLWLPQAAPLTIIMVSKRLSQTKVNTDSCSIGVQRHMGHKDFVCRGRGRLPVHASHQHSCTRSPDIHSNQVCPAQVCTCATAGIESRKLGPPRACHMDPLQASHSTQYREADGVCSQGGKTHPAAARRRHSPGPPHLSPRRVLPCCAVHLRWVSPEVPRGMVLATGAVQK